MTACASSGKAYACSCPCLAETHCVEPADANDPLIDMIGTSAEVHISVPCKFPALAWISCGGLMRCSSSKAPAEPCPAASLSSSGPATKLAAQPWASELPFWMPWILLPLLLLQVCTLQNMQALECLWDILSVCKGSPSCTQQDKAPSGAILAVFACQSDHQIPCHMACTPLLQPCS